MAKRTLIMLLTLLLAAALLSAGCITINSEDDDDTSGGPPTPDGHAVFSTGVGMIGSPTLLYLDLDYTKYGDNAAQLSPIADLSYLVDFHPQNGAQFKVLGVVNFDAVSYAQVAGETLSAIPIQRSSLTMNTVVVYRTSMGHYGKFKVTSYRGDGGIVMDCLSWV